MKIWSLPKHENLITGNKILWKREEIASKEQFLLFSTIFSTYARISNFKSPITYIFVKCGCSIYFFLNLEIGYVEVRISRNILENPLEFKITRVDCIVVKGKMLLRSSVSTFHILLQFFRFSCLNRGEISLRDKRLFQTSEVEITRVDFIFILPDFFWFCKKCVKSWSIFCQFLHGRQHVYTSEHIMPVLSEYSRTSIIITPIIQNSH